MTKEQALRLKYILGDTIAIVSSFFLSEYMIFGHSLPLCILFLAVYVLIFGAVFTLSGYYNKPFAKSRIKEFITTFISVVLSYMIISLLIYLPILSQPIYLIPLLVSFALVYCIRLFITQWDRYQGNKGKIKQNIFLVMSGKVGKSIFEWLQIQKSKRIIAISDVDINAVTEKLSELNIRDIDEVVIASDNIDIEILDKLLPIFVSHNIRVLVSALGLVHWGIKVKADSMYGEPLYDISTPNMSEAGFNIKFVFDKIISFLLLVLLSPLFLILAIIVKMDSKGKVFYSQERIGLRGKPFMIYKFRSMVENAETDTPLLSTQDDTRITKAGDWMRKYRLDELPQLYNVLKGDMSLVGPRPERLYYINTLVERCPNYRLIANIKPGITSWGIVKYGYACNIDEMIERFAYDWIYYENMSIVLDITVLAYTVKTLVNGLGK